MLNRITLDIYKYIKGNYSYAGYNYKCTQLTQIEANAIESSKNDSYLILLFQIMLKNITCIKIIKFICFFINYNIL